MKDLDDQDIPILSDLDNYSINNLRNYYDTIDKHKLNKQVDHFVCNWVSFKSPVHLNCVQTK